MQVLGQEVVSDKDCQLKGPVFCQALWEATELSSLESAQEDYKVKLVKMVFIARRQFFAGKGRGEERSGGNYKPELLTELLFRSSTRMGALGSQEDPSGSYSR